MKKRVIVSSSVILAVVIATLGMAAWWRQPGARITCERTACSGSIVYKNALGGIVVHVREGATDPGQLYLVNSRRDSFYCIAPSEFLDLRFALLAKKLVPSGVPPLKEDVSPIVTRAGGAIQFEAARYGRVTLSE